MNAMEIRSCRDCANFEERRDIDNAVQCNKNRGPYVCCEDFNPRDESINENRLYYRFCLECTNFEDVNEMPLCAKNHIPGVACEEFTERYEQLEAVRQTNLIKTALFTHVIKHSNPEPLPDYLIEAGQKIILIQEM